MPKLYKRYGKLYTDTDVGRAFAKGEAGKIDRKGLAAIGRVIGKHSKDYAEVEGESSLTEYKRQSVKGE